MLLDPTTGLEVQPAGAEPSSLLQLPVVTFKGRVGVVLNLVW
jgi:hypothetical protein